MTLGHSGGNRLNFVSFPNHCQTAKPQHALLSVPPTFIIVTEKFLIISAFTPPQSAPTPKMVQKLLRTSDVILRNLLEKYATICKTLRIRPSPPVGGGEGEYFKRFCCQFHELSPNHSQAIGTVFRFSLLVKMFYVVRFPERVETGLIVVTVEQGSFTNSDMFLASQQ